MGNLLEKENPAPFSIDQAGDLLRRPPLYRANTNWHTTLQKNKRSGLRYTTLMLGAIDHRGGRDPCPGDRPCRYPGRCRVWAGSAGDGIHGPGRLGDGIPVLECRDACAGTQNGGVVHQPGSGDRLCHRADRRTDPQLIGSGGRGAGDRGPAAQQLQRWPHGSCRAGSCRRLRPVSGLLRPADRFAHGHPTRGRNRLTG